MLLLHLATGVALPAKNEHVGETLMYPKPDLDPLPQDFNAPYEGLQFGPMGPSKRSIVEGETTIPSEAEVGTQESSDGEEHEVERYQIASISFHRVETPFIIGLWIFCASLAKIGK